MQWDDGTWFLPLLGTALAALTMAVFACWHRRAPGAKAFAVGMLCIGLWSILYLIENEASGLSSKVFWSNTKFLVMLGLPAAGVMFAIQYTGRLWPLHIKHPWLLAIEPVSMVGLVLTTGSHGLIWNGLWLNDTGELIVRYGPFYWVNLIYSYKLGLMAILTIGRVLYRAGGLFRVRTIVVVAAIFSPMVAHVAYTIAMSNGRNVDFTPYAFLLAVGALLWIFMRRGMLDIVPVARDVVLDEFDDGVIVLDAQGRVLDLNPAARRLMHDTLPYYGRQLHTLLDGWPDGPTGTPPDRLDLHGRVYEVRASRLDGAGGQNGDIIVLHDRTDHERIENALRMSETSFRALFASNPSPMWVYEIATLKFLEVNAAAVAHYGWTRDEFLTMLITDIRPPEEVQSIVRYVRDTASDDFENAGIWRHQARDGRIINVEVASHRLDFEGKPAKLIVVQDVTERLQLEARLQYQASHDPLTELPNRALFRQRLEQALERCMGDGQRLAVLFLDVDNFKVINDGLGHQAGDDLLIHLAHRLQQSVRPEDMVARMGGDEFIVLIESAPSEIDALRAAERISSRIHEQLAEVFRIGDRTVVTGVSIGIATGGERGDSPEDILRTADMALYSAKRQGKNRTATFEPAMEVQAQERLQFDIDLRGALERNQFILNFQPIVHLESGKIIELEALVRWNHPVRGCIGPDDFIPLAEETGLIQQLGRWVLREACYRTSEWQRQFPDLEGQLTIGVNLSVCQFLDPSLVQDIAEILRITELPPGCLKLEITESAMMHDAEAVIGVLTELRRLGIRFAVDDFGTGYSSLAYLRRFPIDTLKIDRVFVDGMDKNDEDTAIVRSIIALANALGLVVVGEGIESPEQLIKLIGLGCDRGQGYLFSRLLPVEEITPLLEHQSRALPLISTAP